jgi:RNA-dependent RNA polymerase
VITCKNPCTHPGDIRLLKAISKDDERYEKLKHLVNVVVFSSKGKRPETHKMSGGDLDGDVYMVIWEPKIVE